MSNDEKYPTIERLADLTNTTVGYQKPDLEREAVLCWRELATLRERLADMEQEAIARDAFQTRLKELKYEAEQRAERAEALADERVRAAVAAERERREQLEAALRESVRDFDLIANWRDGAAKYDADMGNPPRTFCEDVELIEQSAKEAADEARAILGDTP